MRLREKVFLYLIKELLSSIVYSILDYIFDNNIKDDGSRLINQLNSITLPLN
jgi:hypothetical protein